MRTTRQALMESRGIRVREDQPIYDSFFSFRFGDLELAFEPSLDGTLRVALYQHVGSRPPALVEGLQKIPVRWLEEPSPATPIETSVASTLTRLLKQSFDIEATPEPTADGTVTGAVTFKTNKGVAVRVTVTELAP